LLNAENKNPPAIYFRGFFYLYICWVDAAYLRNSFSELKPFKNSLLKWLIIINSRLPVTNITNNNPSHNASFINISNTAYTATAEKNINKNTMVNDLNFIPG
jgi:hypothetical protein